MPKPASRAAETLDVFDLANQPDKPPEDDGSLDLEAYLDLDESPEITQLMQRLRGEGAEAAPKDAPEQQEAPPPAPKDPTRFAPPTARGASPTAAPAAAPKDPPRFTPPMARGASPTAAPAPTPKEPPRVTPPRARRASPTASPAAAPRGDRGRPDLAAVARALGEVHVQARQLVVACPRCEGRVSIVIGADRFKCFGCEATGGEAALAALLTGWDARRVAAWLAAAGEAPAVQPDVRRPWRLSLFAR